VDNSSGVEIHNPRLFVLSITSGGFKPRCISARQWRRGACAMAESAPDGLTE
jgi:hypothetical protein